MRDVRLASQATITVFTVHHYGTLILGNYAGCDLAGLDIVLVEYTQLGIGVSLLSLRMRVVLLDIGDVQVKVREAEGGQWCSTSEECIVISGTHESAEQTEHGECCIIPWIVGANDGM